MTAYPDTISTLRVGKVMAATRLVPAD